MDSFEHALDPCEPLLPPAPNPEPPFARIAEQPAKCGVRFRYECEGRISGAIPGAHSTPLRPTFPAIRIFNYAGRARVLVSCVTRSPPHRAHPHNLVGKRSCSSGVCSLVVTVTEEQPLVVFSNLGILCAKRKDIRERLKQREALQVDPFQCGFQHRAHAFKALDLQVVRLAFQVFLEAPADSGHFCVALEPLLSEPIFDKKA